MTSASTVPEATPAGADEPAIARRRWQPSNAIFAALVAGGIILLWWLYTYWPIPIDPANYQPSPPGDGWGGTSIWQALVREGLNPFTPGKVQSFNAPEGWDVTWEVNLQQWPTTFLYYGITWLTGDADVAMNWYLAIGVIGTAASMAWFVARFVVDDRWIAILAGVALTWEPLVMTKAGGHTAFVHLGPVVLMMGAVLIAWERPSWKTTFIAGLAAFVAMSWSGYHLLLAGVAFATLLAGGTLVQLRGGRAKEIIWSTVRIALFAGIGLLITAVLLTLIGRGADPVEGIRQNDLNALYVFSARWYEYVLPTSHSTLFGDYTRDYLFNRLHGSNGSETSLYQGATLMLLALLGTAWALVPKWRAAVRPSSVRSPLGLLFVVGPLTVIVAGIWSLPPMISPFGIAVPTPSKLVFEFVTTWRVYARFALIVSIGLIIIAALGLRWIAGSGKRRIAVLAVASILIPLDLNVRMDGAERVDQVQVAQVLRKLPHGIVASYPLERGEFESYGTQYHQQFYGQPVFNAFDDQPEEGRAAGLKDLSQTQTIQRLSVIGVRYVLAIQRPTQPGDPIVPLEPNKLLKRIAVSQYGPWRADIYEVPKVAGAFAALGPAFLPPEGAPGAQMQWTSANSADVELDGRCAGGCQGVVRFGIQQFDRQRLTATLNGKPVPFLVRGRERSSVDVTSPRVLQIPVEFNGKAKLTLTASPGAIPVQSIDPNNPDSRSLSFAATGLRFVEDK